MKVKALVLTPSSLHRGVLGPGSGQAARTLEKRDGGGFGRNSYMGSLSENLTQLLGGIVFEFLVADLF